MNLNIDLFFKFKIIKAFVTCTKGVKFVGMTMICFGVTDVIGAVFFIKFVYLYCLFYFKYFDFR
jgi:hypothetical protein